jgi:perosamine synthetase
MTERLAIDGGPPVRTEPLPSRRLFAEAELEMVRQVFEDSWERGRDFSFQGKFEDQFTKEYCAYHGGGFADAVNSGTSAVFVALRALELPAGCDVVVSPITNSADPMAISMAGLNPVLADSAPGSPNVDAASFENAVTPNTKAALLTHTAGFPIDMPGVLDVAAAHGIAVIEDSSQAHGARLNGRQVGTFGALSAASTGFSKTLATGGSGGVVYTQKEELYWRIRSHADRGKPFDHPEFDFKNPSLLQFPALNFNLDEMSCAIGISILARLDDINRARLDIYELLAARLSQESAAVSVYRPPMKDCVPALFFCPMVVDIEALGVDKRQFADAIAAEGVWLNSHYRELVSEWPWYVDRFGGAGTTPNAVAFRDTTFNLLYHEAFTDSDVDDIVAAIVKVEAAYRR